MDISPSSTAKALFHRQKLAVALACISSKPANLTARQYTQRLCDQFHCSQLHWKERCQQAQSEILHLKQKLILANLNTTGLSQRTKEQDDTGSESLFPTPPLSGALQTAACFAHKQDCETPTETFLTGSTVFFQSLIQLQTGAQAVSSKNIDSVTEQSLLTSLDIVRDKIGSQWGVRKTQNECISCILTILTNASSTLKGKIITKVCAVITLLIEQILSKQQQVNPEQKKRNSDLLVQFANSKDVTEILLTLLVDETVKFADHLRRVSRGDSELDSDYFSNVFYIVDAIYRCVTLPVETTDNFKENLQMRLEDCLLHVTDSFPLFAHAVWRIQARILH